MPNTSGLPFGYPAAKRSKLRLNVGWRFHLGDVSGAAQADFDDASWELVNIPHTLKLTSLNLDGCDDDKTQPTFHREVGWYRRAFTVDADPARKVFLEFEGAHQVTDAWVNGQHVGQHAIDGYTPFHFSHLLAARRVGRQRLDERRGTGDVRRPHAGGTRAHRTHRRHGRPHP